MKHWSPALANMRAVHHKGALSPIWVLHILVTVKNYKYRPHLSMIYWDQIQSHQNSKHGISEAGCLQGLLIMLLGAETLLFAVA